MPFIFVKHGDPPPLEWMARHPGWVKFPAVMIPRNSPGHPANGGRLEVLDPLAEARSQIYETLQERIREVDPTYATLTEPIFRPSQKDIDSVRLELESARTRIVSRIANGRAFRKHGEAIWTTSTFSS